MYQFYISAKKDAVMAANKTITKDTLPAVTQLFTPDWIVRYMAENHIEKPEEVQSFDRLGYRFEESLSTPDTFVFLLQPERS